MKILLVGEYSGVHKNLMDGLLELGFSVKTISNSDGWKKVGYSDYKMFSNNKNKYFKKIEDFFLQNINIKKIENYDVVQIINSNIFGGTIINHNFNIISKFRKKSNKMFMLSCGTDYYVYKLLKNLRYSYIEDNIKIDLNSINPYIKKSYIKNNNKVIDLIDGIIPTTYTYAEAYRNHPKLLNTIPFPINLDKVKYKPQKIENNKIKIFHGLNREGFKGTKYIREAMELIKEKYPNEVDILIDGKMPLKKYLKILRESNIIIDQALSYSYGMNAIYSMAMGKVVLSGNEPECQKEFGRNDIPVINITPSVEDIYNKLEKLILNKKSIEEIGYKSRLFVEDFHDYRKVAKKYLETWKKCGDNN